MDPAYDVGDGEQPKNI
jgi:hypothetical protein